MGIIKKVRKKVEGIGMPEDAAERVEELKKNPPAEEEEEVYENEDVSLKEEEDDGGEGAVPKSKPKVPGKAEEGQGPSLQEYLMFEPNYRAEIIMQLGRIATTLEKLEARLAKKIKKRVRKDPDE